MSPWVYNLFTKMKEPLWGTQYNTRGELICAIERSIWNINKDGCTHGLRRLPNIWQKVINKGATILKVHKCCIPVNKAISEISNCCNYFSSNPCIYGTIALAMKEHRQLRVCSSSKKLCVSKNKPNSVQLVPLQRLVSHVAALFICFRACLYEFSVKL